MFNNIGFVIPIFFYEKLWLLAIKQILSSPKPGQASGRSRLGTWRGSRSGPGTLDTNKAFCPANKSPPCPSRHLKNIPWTSFQKHERAIASTKPAVDPPIDRQSIIGCFAIKVWFITRTVFLFLNNGSMFFCHCKCFSCDACQGITSLYKRFCFDMLVYW